MSLVLSPLTNPQTPFQGINNDQTTIDVYFLITPSGNYPAGGDLMDLTQLGDLIMSNEYAPLWVEIQSAKPGGVSGNVYDYAPAASAPTMRNGLFQLLKGQAAGTVPAFVDAGAQAYPASVTGDTIIGKATLIRL
jgi:hypothetical protein